MTDLADKISYFKTAVLPSCLTSTTAYDPAKWSLYKPTTGHCSLVAYFLYSQLGGQIMRCTARRADGSEELHYFNKIDGVDVDCTKDQFDDSVVFENIAEREPERTLDDDSTKHRYAMFERRVQHAMKTKGFSFAEKKLAS